MLEVQKVPYLPETYTPLHIIGAHMLSMHAWQLLCVQGSTLDSSLR